MMIEEIFASHEENMKKTMEALKREFASLRAGRATPSLLDKVLVDYYGTPTPLNQVATLSVPESSLIVIQPWDVSVIKEIEKALLRSDLGITPSKDGKVIRLAIPALTEERRKEMAKLVKKRAEAKKVVVRQLLRDANEALKKLEKDKKITEDDFHQGQEKIQKITDDFIKSVDDLTAKKEQELLQL